MKENKRNPGWIVDVDCDFINLFSLSYLLNWNSLLTQWMTTPLLLCFIRWEKLEKRAKIGEKKDHNQEETRADQKKKMMMLKAKLRKIFREGSLTDCETCTQTHFTDGCTTIAVVAKLLTPTLWQSSYQRERKRGGNSYLKTNFFFLREEQETDAS